MLKRLGAKSEIDPIDWRDKEIITSCINRVGKPSFKMFERILKTYVDNVDQSKSGGFFKLGMIIGESRGVQTPKGDVDALWDRMVTVYGDNENGIQAIKKILGTLLMIIIAEDERYWVWEPDPEKKDKLDKGEKPEGNIYYKEPDRKKYSIDDVVKKYSKKK